MGKDTIIMLRTVIACLLIGVSATALAQSPPRTENPLPPGAVIPPLDNEAQPAATSAAAAPAGEIGHLPDFSQIQRARDALEELLRAYETGNIGLIQRRLDPSMVGYQVFLDGVRRDVSALKNLRINLTDTQVTVGPDLAVIQTNWEKRFVGVTDFRPGIHTGRSTILLHRDGEQWRLSAVARDNLFSSASGTLARFTVTPQMLGSNGLDGQMPVQVEVVDPDMAGLRNLQLAAASSTGDRETLTLPEVSPGVFRVMTVQMTGRNPAATPGNGVLELVPGQLGIPVGTFTFTYIDANPGENRPPSTLTRVIRVQ